VCGIFSSSSCDGKNEKYGNVFTALYFIHNRKQTHKESHEHLVLPSIFPADGKTIQQQQYIGCG
jgi:hypothetical protein